MSDFGIWNDTPDCRELPAGSGTKTYEQLLREKEQRDKEAKQKAEQEEE